MTDLPTAPLSPGDGGGGGRRRMLGVEQPGDEIGPYRLISPLGEGGFAVVWLAERRQPFVQRVALKLIKPGMDSKAVVARFEQERQALAVMNHPHIAKVLDGGVSPSGRPYFAMELVKGEPITSYCDAERLPIERRLELFAQVCDAVQHAHMKGIIHRDLKPSNVLVSRGEGDRAVVKVIDFGVAKALTQRLTERTVFTETGQMIGTPEYMSPEQAEPDATDIDTRSDVYSLGVLLYELLVGALPFEPSELRSKAYREIQRIIREEPAPAPSTRLTGISTQDRARAESIARNRRAAEGELSRRLRNELEWIPLKAMKKSREERYGSPQELGEDVRRYLRGERLSAGPDSAAYRLRKWVVRNERWMGAGIAIFGVVAFEALQYLNHALRTAFNEQGFMTSSGGVPIVVRSLFLFLPLGGAWVFLASWIIPIRGVPSLWHRLAAPLATFIAIPLLTMYCAFYWQPYILVVGATGLAALLWVASLISRSQGGGFRRCLLVTVLAAIAWVAMGRAGRDISERIRFAGSEAEAAAEADRAALEQEPRADQRPSWSADRIESLRRFEILDERPDPARILDPAVRERILATGRPWRIRHQATGVVLLLVPPGEFTMGSPDTEIGRRDDELQHRREIRRAFYLAEDELRVSQFLSVASPSDAELASIRSVDATAPMQAMRWERAVRFLMTIENSMRLPSEAEWEYACRAGTTTAFATGGDPPPLAFQESPWANPWGFRGMHGGVEEPCFDRAAPYGGDATEQPIWSPRGPRVFRGGSFSDTAEQCRSAARRAVQDSDEPGWERAGLRLACDADRVEFAGKN